MANITRRPGEGREAAPTTFFDPFRMMREMLRFDPFREMEAYIPGPERTFTPSFEVKETKDAYVFYADLPGVKEEDLDISLSGNRLTVSGKREREERKEDESYYAYERAYGSFTRSFTLPDDTDVEHVTAELKNGELRITIPKKPEMQPKRIQVKGQEKGETQSRAKA